jgi:ferredoxin
MPTGAAAESRSPPMKVKVDADTCTACGLCAESCPAVFKMNSVAEVIADPVPAQDEACAREAAENCPVEAIAVE